MQRWILAGLIGLTAAGASCTDEDPVLPPLEPFSAPWASLSAISPASVPAPSSRPFTLTGTGFAGSAVTVTFVADANIFEDGAVQTTLVNGTIVDAETISGMTPTTTVTVPHVAAVTVEIDGVPVEGSAALLVTPPTAEDSTPVTISGTLSYEKPDLDVDGTPPDGLGATDTAKPIRHADVTIVRQAAGQVVAGGSTDASGNYSISLPPQPDQVFVRVAARTFLSADYRLQVLQHGTATANPQAPVFVAESGPVSGSADHTVSFTVPTGSPDWASAPFSTLDMGVTVADAVRSVTGTLPWCTFYYQQGNAAEIGISYYSADDDAVWVLGGAAGAFATTDTDPFDDSIIGHEFGHFMEDNFSHLASPGGPHFIPEQAVNPVLAYSEGYGSFVGAVALGDPRVTDTIGYAPTQSVAFTVNAESHTGHGTTAPPGPFGIFDEFAALEVLWDLYDGGSNPADADGDGLSTSFANIFSAFAALDEDTDFPYMMDILGALDSANGGPFATAALTGLMTAPEATNMVYPPAGASVWPVPITINGAAETGTAVASSAPMGGVYSGTSPNFINGADARHFYEFTVPGGSTMNVTIELTMTEGTGVDPHDLDLYLYRPNSGIGLGAVMDYSMGTTTVETISTNLSPGVYAAEVRAFYALGPVYVAQDETDYSLSITSP